MKRFSEKVRLPVSAAILVASGLMWSTASHAERLVFANVNAKTAEVNTGFLNDWVERINESGAVDMRVRYGPALVNFTNFYDRVIDGVADVSFGVTVFNPGRFPNSLIFTMPFVIDSSEQASLTACEMYEAGHFGDEFNDIKPLLFAQFPNSTFHTKSTPITGMETFNGLKVIATAPPTVDVARAYGAQALSIDLGDAYQALQRGTADGMIMGYTAFKTFQLGDQLKHHYDLPLGGALSLVFISRDKYDTLGQDAKAVIDEFSTCEESRKFGAYIDVWNEAERQVLADVTGKKAHTFTELEPEVLKSLQDRFTEEFKTKFIDNLPGGESLMNAFLDTLESVKQ